jgi:hypothetical protein
VRVFSSEKGFTSFTVGWFWLLDLCLAVFRPVDHGLVSSESVDPKLVDFWLVDHGLVDPELVDPVLVDSRSINLDHWPVIFGAITEIFNLRVILV